MVVLAEFRRWQPAAIEAVFGQFGRARDALLDADPDLQAARTPGNWVGAAAEAAGREYERLAERCRRTAAAVTALRPAVARAADDLAALHRELDQITAVAAARGYRLADDGTVFAPGPLSQLPAHPAATSAAQAEQWAAAELRQLTTGLTDLLRRAEALDGALADALTAASSGLVDDGTAAGLADAAVHVLGGDRPPPAPPADATPGQNAQWWAGLSPAQQERLLLTDPGLIGNRDGIPAAVRDEANRARLDDETARIDAGVAAAQERLAAHDASAPVGRGSIYSPARVELALELAELQDQRDALATVADTVAADPANNHLLLLDVDGHDEPRAAIAVGDVDTADHVAVYTPGFTTNVADSLPGVAGEVTALRNEALDQLADARQPNATVAAVAWIGYDIPQVDTTGSGDRSVGGDAAAREGGHELARFVDGIITSRPGDDPHLTALGHSYGSTTTGFALQEARGVDDAVIFGSPGPGTFDLSTLNVPPGRLGVIEADGDLVADAGWFGPDPNQLPELTQLSADAARVDGEDLTASTGHSEYTAPGSTSQHNLGATVAGLPGNRVLTEDNSDVGDEVREGIPFL